MIFLFFSGIKTEKKEKKAIKNMIEYPDIGEDLKGEFNPSTHTFTISGTGEMTDWPNLPSVPWNSNRSGINILVIGSGVKKIGKRAFMEFNALSSVIMPNDTTSSLSLIGDSAFYSCGELSLISIPTTVTVIQDYAFFNCKKLGSITMPNDISAVLHAIGSFAFSQCTELKSITIPSSVTSIGSGVFLYDYKLQSIIVGGNNQHFVSDNNIFYNFKKTILIRCLCNVDGSIQIPETVEIIMESAFDKCELISAVTFPINSKLVEIQTFAFTGCTQLYSIKLPSMIKVIASYAFISCTDLRFVKFCGLRNPSGVEWDIFTDTPLVPGGKVQVPKNYQDDRFSMLEVDKTLLSSECPIEPPEKPNTRNFPIVTSYLNVFLCFLFHMTYIKL